MAVQSRILMGAIGMTIATVCWLPVTAQTVWPYIVVRSASHWPATPCRIESAGLTHDQERHRKGWQDIVRVDIRYTYEIAGHRYLGSDIYPVSLTSTDPADLAALIEPYVPGQPSLCHVNPQQPAQSLLIIRWLGIPPGHRGSILLLGVAGACGAYLALIAAFPRLPGRPRFGADRDPQGWEDADLRPTLSGPGIRAGWSLRRDPPS